MMKQNRAVDARHRIGRPIILNRSSWSDDSPIWMQNVDLVLGQLTNQKRLYHRDL